MQNNQLKAAYRAIKEIFGKAPNSQQCRINEADGHPCASKEATLTRWQEHYETVLSHPPAASCPDLDQAAGAASEVPDMRSDAPSLQEVRDAIGRLKNGRAAGPDGIPPELLKCALHPTSVALHTLFRKVWSEGRVPAAWKDGIITALYKGKGSKAECCNYRPITLLSVSGKVFAHVLLARMKPLLLSSLRPQQSGFTSGRSTADAILSLRLLVEIPREFGRPLDVA